MNRAIKELLNKCIKVGSMEDKVPLLDDLYIIPTRKKHDSGYKIMYVVGGVRKPEHYFLLDVGSDVVNFGYFKTTMENINLDIKDNGIIHFWSNKEKFKSGFRVSSCTFELVKEVDND